MVALSKALEDTDDSLEAVNTARKLRHEQLEEELFRAQKNAHLRSGSRGMQARKELKAAEAKVTDSADLSVARDPQMVATLISY